MDVSLIAFLFFSNSSFASNVVSWAASCFSCRWVWKKTVTWQKKITARDTLMKIAVPRKTIVLLTRNRSTVWNRDRNHANALGNYVGKQPSVTNSGNVKERISHGYVPLCALKKTSGRARKQRTKILGYLRTCKTQYTRVSSSNNMINIAAKAAWTRIPTVKSVKARNASSALSRDFALTEAITSAFKTAVIGKVMILKMMRKTRKLRPRGKGDVVFCQIQYS